MAVPRALRQGDQRAEARAQRGHPGAQLPDAGNLPLRRRRSRRLPAARRSPASPTRRGDRAGRRAFHGRNLENSQPRKDRADPRHARPAARSPPRSPAPTSARLRKQYPGVSDRRLCQHLGRGEGRGRHLLHLLQRAEGRREPRHGSRDHAARPISGANVAAPDQGEDHRLARRLRGARAFHGRGNAALSRRRSRREDHRASRMPAAKSSKSATSPARRRR